MSKSPPLVYVEWSDSCSPVRKWQSIDSMKGYTASPCRSVGWLMEKTATAIVLAASLGRDGQGEAGDWTAIPRSVVTKIRRLK